MPIASPFPTIDIPKKDIHSFLFEREDRPFPEDQVVYIDGNTKRQLTYADVRDQTKTFGIGLKSHWSWRRGDVLAVYSTNQIDTPLIIWGTLWAGGIITTANPGYGVEELSFQLKDSRAKALVTLADLLPIAEQAAANAGIPKDRIIILGDKKTNEYKHWKEITDPSTTVSWRKTRVPDPEKELAYLVYSSGTTGLPKGVMLSHKNIVANLLQFTPNDPLDWTEDRLVAFLPFFHIYGLTCIMHHAILRGLPTVVMDRFDLNKFCQHIQDYRVTFAYLVPPVILLLAKHPDVAKYDFSSLKMVNSGAAPLTRELVESVWARLKVSVKQGYGLSETSPVTHSMRWSQWKSHIGSVGPLIANMTAKYVNEEGVEVPAGESGELWMAGPNIMMGYLNNPTATAGAITPDGFFKTGDVGYQDGDGNFYITDRVKELIKYKGSQVAPAELEGLLLGHEKVDDCAVVGVYSPEIASEVPRAYVVLAAGAERTKDTELELIKYVEYRVAQHKRLRGGIRFLDAIPKSISGKILRRVLRDMAEEEDQGEAAPKAKL
ncbi:acetyl-CoA synthetase-like protein [Tuber magnatum]|uniref:Acetyl-CoA synthetase-like protein n=1 Tax=Tuber magnatum TaxID=42249 RepID=A0A317SL89_9PEZI|nr:acetyl-CoA synthetase-like protein [Tuber magnatum]